MTVLAGVHGHDVGRAVAGTEVANASTGMTTTSVCAECSSALLHPGTDDNADTDAGPIKGGVGVPEPRAGTARSCHRPLATPMTLLMTWERLPFNWL
jgi:hypothetical protein